MRILSLKGEAIFAVSSSSSSVRGSGFEVRGSRSGPRTPNREPSLRFPLYSCDYFLADVLRRRFVPIEVHGIRRASLRARPQVRRVAEHLGQRHARLDDLAAAAIFLRLDLPAPA